MKPNRFIQWIALAIVILGYAGLFTWLLADTLDHSSSFDVRPVLTYVTPIFSGALGLILALSLGVEPKTESIGTGIVAWIKSLFGVPKLLLLGAIVYLASGVAGAIVWGIKGDVTPELVTTVILTVAGYLGATAAALARA